MNDNEIIEIAQSKLEKFGLGRWYKYVHPHIDEGSEFKFITLNSYIGFKFRRIFYNNPLVVDRAFDRQGHAYNKGVGPKPIKMLEFLHGKDTYKGYTTELATQVGLATISDMYALEDKMYRLNMQDYAYDISPANMGVYKGQWVSIDFGDLSVQRDYRPS